MSASVFTKTLTSFCEEMRLTLPELSASIDRAASMTPAEFITSWLPNLAVLKSRDADSLFTKCNGVLLAPVKLTRNLWSELSETTHAALWKYLRTLALEASVEVESETVDAASMEILMQILMEEKIGTADPKATMEESMKHLKPLLDRLKEFMSSPSTGAPGSSPGSETPFPEIPERLRNGKIAKLAEELTKQFDPREFGIDPALLHGDNIEVILPKIAEMFQKDPTKLMAGAKNMAEKIKRKITSGSINREELLAEAQEYMKLFKDHPLFKEGIEKMETMMGGGGLAEMFRGETAEPSARRSAVQERLRKKLAARNKSGPQSK